MSNVTNLKNEEFETFIATAQKPVLVDFFADWCGPCRLQSPIIDKVANDLSESVIVAKVNTDNCLDVCMKYNITSIPTLLLFKGGSVAEKSVGLTSEEEIAALINKHV